MREPLAMTSSRWLLQASETPASSRRNAGLGKYVPQKKGTPAGVRKQVMGQPPCPVIAVVADM